MSKGQQSCSGEYTAGTTTETVTRTIKCPLETSDRKREYLRSVIEEWQDIARFTAERLKSFQRYDISRNNPQVYSIVKEWDDLGISAAIARDATYKAVEAYESWYELGQQGRPPMGQFGDGNYLRLSNQQLTIAENDRGYGVKLNLVPRDAEWFHIGGGEYQADWLERVVDEDDSTRVGSSEVRLDSEQAYLHLVVVTEVEVYKPDDVSTRIGVDLGENALYAAAVTGPDGIQEVEMESGREFRHYRDELDRRRKRLSQKGDLQGVRQCRGERERYTEHVTHTATKTIVELAQAHAPCKIRLEEMGNYRETVDDPIHDWPRGMLAEQICYKATAAGIPVEFVESPYTSKECNRCDQRGLREGPSFECRRCDYEVHADVNAAINIAHCPPKDD
ncbi:RNA-guided endonuclease InsQ/TnpB family protein [Halalkalicoccus subterraneus]|uniref:RNA-guided endonuclease InsQ/TnpB family protein n=1 Tax=Halalkalicoccus subterraneus TaxID=2675002 RepID=UPI000EFC1860|nr:RNA-guided endonuclease TnpB family protein [Halalkalicoccus subterraneus]